MKIRTQTGLVVGVSLLAGTGLLFLLVHVLTFLYLPPGRRGGEPESVVVEIPEGATLRETARLLAGNGLISSVETFILIGKLVEIERRVIPGEYAFHNQMFPLEILHLLKSGRVVLYDVTIPEGYNLAQIARLLEDKKLADADEFIRKATDPEFILGLGYASGSLEGYLYPESYYFTKRIGEEGILRTLVGRFEAVFNEEMRERAAAIGMTVPEVVTLASMIEKETSRESERSLVSAVFHNRIKKKMPLQSDPTVIYALPDFKGRLTRKDLKTRTPYNTYHIKGLPRGPIASPGKASLWAALYPADADDLYFVSKNDGSHHFSKTLAEHNRAVDKYQRRSGEKAS